MPALRTQQSNPSASAERPNRFAKTMPMMPKSAVTGMDIRLATAISASTKES